MRPRTRRMLIVGARALGSLGLWMVGASMMWVFALLVVMLMHVLVGGQ